MLKRILRLVRRNSSLGYREKKLANLSKDQVHTALGQMEQKLRPPKSRLMKEPSWRI